MAARVARGGDKPSLAASKVLAAIREATGASDEDIAAMLALCGGDANEATEKLLTSEFLNSFTHITVLFAGGRARSVPARRLCSPS
jgi:hypothetical protein